MLRLFIFKILGIVLNECLMIWHALLRFYFKVRPPRSNIVPQERWATGMRSGTRNYPPARAGYWSERFHG
jgi:hypothetical protein